MECKGSDIKMTPNNQPAEISHCYYESPVGILEIAENGTGICFLHFCGITILPMGETEYTPLLRQTRSELDEYFSGKRTTFSVPISPHGTTFQMRVWKELLKIPYGEMRTYGQIAAAVGNPRASRAVGMANNKNPIAIIIPCHRVIGVNGKLIGYAGGLDKKQNLLELERDAL